MKCVLVVDDNPDIRVVASAILDYAGFATRQAGDGREAIRSVLQHPPDLILCDIRMPEMDGYLTLEAIRKSPGIADIPFIFMTGNGDQSEFHHAIALGANDLLFKPFAALELISAVETRLAQPAPQGDACQEFHQHSLPSFSPESAFASAA
jgi:two-component system, sensor histidine kinase and response regulator